MKYKYPRTLHLPFSEGKTNDDKVLNSTSHFEGKQVVVTEKMDGENSTLYRDDMHARSLDSSHHESRSWLKNLHNQIKYLIPEDMRICGENLYARHSIEYNNLDSYFYAFSVWKNETCLSWEESKEILQKLNITTVPVLYEGVYDEKLIKSLYRDHMEGYIVRLKNSFTYNEFSKSVAKFVRKNHVQTEQHWMHQKVVPNKLK